MDRMPDSRILFSFSFVPWSQLSLVPLTLLPRLPRFSPAPLLSAAAAASAAVPLAFLSGVGGENRDPE